MRILFLVADGVWSARARAFVLAARGLAARGHGVMFACEAECPVQVRVAASEIPVIALEPDATVAGDAWQLRRAMSERGVDVILVHTEQEQLIASSALRLGGGGAVVVRRIPPFTLANDGAGARLANRLAPSALLFCTEADRAAANVGRYPIATSVAPVGVDAGEYDTVRPASRESLGARPESRLIVAVHDGSDRRRILSALRTLALLAPRHPELHLAIVGATTHDELRMHGAALGVNSMVTYVAPTEDELPIIRAADLGWIAAEGDAAAFGALDFMGCRIAVLAERSPLAEHYVADGIAGVLLDPADRTTTAASVAAFLARDEQRVAMGNAGRARLQREFTLNAMIDGFERVITEAAGRRAEALA